MKTNLAQLASGSRNHHPVHQTARGYTGVPYDIKKAQARFLEAGLSDFDAERIAMGS